MKELPAKQFATDMALSEAATRNIITAETNTSPSYGTSSSKYRMWFDYVYDYFGADLAHRFRILLVSTCIGGAVFVIGLFIALLSGHQQLYLSTSAVYVLCFAIAYSLGSFRWLSLSYHIATNNLRICFDITNGDYRTRVNAVAKQGVDWKSIVVPTSVLSAFICGYVGLVTFGSSSLRTVIMPIYSRAVPQNWQIQNDVAIFIIVNMFSLIFVAIAVTSTQLALTFMRYMLRLRNVPAIPWPSLIADCSTGILDLSLIGTVGLGVGFACIEFLFKTKLDVLGVTIAAIPILLALSVLIAPRLFLRRLLTSAKKTLRSIMLDFVFPRMPGQVEIENIRKASSILHFELIESNMSRTVVSLIAFVLSQVFLPLLTLIINTLNSEDLLQHLLNVFR